MLPGRHTWVGTTGCANQGQPLAQLQNAGLLPWVWGVATLSNIPAPLTARLPSPKPLPSLPLGWTLPCHHFPPLPSCLFTLILVLFAMMTHTSTIPSSQLGGLHSLGQSS